MADNLLIDSLHGIRRRVRVLTFLRGAGIVVAWAAGLMFLAALLDYLLRLPVAPRMVVVVAAAAGVGYAAWRWLVRPALAKLSISDVAGHLEESFPQFDDRLRSSVVFASGDVPGSEVMKARTTADAARMAQSLNLNDAIATRPVWASLAAGLGAVTAVVVIAILFPTTARILMNRMFGGNAELPKSVQITSVEGLPDYVAYGDRVPVRVRIGKGSPSKVVAYFKFDDGHTENVTLVAEEGEYVGSISARSDAHALQVWVKAGDDQTDPRTIAVVPGLAISRVEAVIDPPDYTEARPEPAVDLAARAANATVGATASVIVRFNKPLAAGTNVMRLVQLPEATPIAAKLERTMDGAREIWTATFPLTKPETLRFRVEARDIHGFHNPATEEYQVVVKRDAIPSVVIERPQKNEDRTPQSFVPLQLLVEDDYGFDERKLIVTRDRGGEQKGIEVDLDKLDDWQPVTGDLGSAERRRYRINWDWELSKAFDDELKPGDKLEVHVRVVDNYKVTRKPSAAATRPQDDAGPDETVDVLGNGDLLVRHAPVSSGKVVITIISQEQLQVQANDQMRQIYEQVQSVDRLQERTLVETRNLREQVGKNEGKFDSSAQMSLQRLTDQQGSAMARTGSSAKDLENLRTRLEQNRASEKNLQDRANEVGRTMRQIADGAMSNATRNLSGAQDPSAGNKGQQEIKPAGEKSDPADGNSKGEPKSAESKAGNPDGKTPATQGSGAEAKGNGDTGKADKGSEAKGTEEKGSEGKGSEAKGSESKGSEAKGSEGKGTEAKGSEAKGSEAKGSEGKGSESKGSESKGSEASQAGGSSGQQSPSQSSLSRAEKNQQQASDQLKQALQKMGSFGDLERLRKETEKALAEQMALSDRLKAFGEKHLGEEVEKMSPEVKKELKDLAAAQQKAAENTQKLTEQLNKSAQNTQQSDPAGSKAMKDAAGKSQSQGVSSNQQQAAEQMSDNKMGGAQPRQKQAELGLKMMADVLREAERNKLAQLIEQLAEMKEKIAGLVKRQAGHNIDNLALMDRKKEAEDTALVKKAGRDVKPLAQPTEMAALVRGQQLTERNSRTYAGDAEKLQKGGAEIAAGLTKAAGFMERGIGLLVDEKKDEAYKPSQVDALKALEDCLADIEQQEKEAKDANEEQDRDTLRQTFEKIRDDQLALNGRTTAIDGSPRDKDGSYLDRKMASELTGLPNKQGDLSGRTGKLTDQLAKLSSIVYVWAARDIVSSMDSVKEDLARPETGVPTQSEQARIIEQLDAMIKNLAIKPKKSEFAQAPPPGGGGSGDGPPKKPTLPSEVEIRMLQALQLALNNSTIKIEKDGVEKNKQKLTALGSRQGELRTLLRELFKAASEGKIDVGEKEPDPRDLLPEKATAEQVTNEEEQRLLAGKAEMDPTEKQVVLNADRMSRSGQRLALRNDPGMTTQEIQKRIIMDLEKMADDARQSSSSASGQPKPGEGKQPKPGEGEQADNQGTGKPGKGSMKGGNTAAAKSTMVAGPGGTGPTTDIRQTAKTWGELTPRMRDAVMEGSSESIIEKYRQLTMDYYRNMASKASERSGSR